MVLPSTQASLIPFHMKPSYLFWGPVLRKLGQQVTVSQYWGKARHSSIKVTPLHSTSLHYSPSTHSRGRNASVFSDNANTTCEWKKCTLDQVTGSQSGENRSPPVLLVATMTLPPREAHPGGHSHIQEAIISLTRLGFKQVPSRVPIHIDVRGYRRLWWGNRDGVRWQEEGEERRGVPGEPQVKGKGGPWLATVSHPQPSL